MLQYAIRDVTTVTNGVVAHGCNAQGVMGSGVAKAIRAKWPKAYERYNSVCMKWKHPKSELLGLSVIVNVGESNFEELNTLFVANMITQESYGKDGRVYASAPAIRKAVESTMSFCRGSNLDLYMPRVGCGLGGLKWDNIGPMIEQLADAYGVQVHICDLE